VNIYFEGACSWLSQTTTLWFGWLTKDTGHSGALAIALPEQRGENTDHVDALSRRQHHDELTCLVEMQPCEDAKRLVALQLGDLILQVIITALESSPHKAPFWRRSALLRFRQIWGQLKLMDNAMYRHFQPGPTSDYKYSIVLLKQKLSVEISRRLWPSRRRLLGEYGTRHCRLLPNITSVPASKSGLTV